ncbi:hypothetical protein Sjap_024811 [Stephania japonica]|uniref:Uncharacterized protein n=1 Tax=Stephania japonica TaxID=461633 RepID=A0AAP0HLV5_9MAGN
MEDGESLYRVIEDRVRFAFSTDGEGSVDRLFGDECWFVDDHLISTSGGIGNVLRFSIRGGFLGRKRAGFKTPIRRSLASTAAGASTARDDPTQCLETTARIAGEIDIYSSRLALRTLLPPDSDKIMLAKQTGLIRSQPMVEEMCNEETKNEEQNGMDEKTGKNDPRLQPQGKSVHSSASYRMPTVRCEYGVANFKDLGDRVRRPKGDKFVFLTNF